MKNFFRLIKICCIVYTTCFFCYEVSAAEYCYSDMSEVLGCFLEHYDGIYRYEFVGVNNDNPDVTIKTYLLYSQKWPPIDQYPDIPATIWQHRLILYIPTQISYPKALLYVNGGYNRNVSGFDEFFLPKEGVDFSGIAATNKALVVELQDVPNQYLFFGDDQKPFREDQILAYTYKKFMDDPFRNAYLPGHLPMAKAILRAMDATQEILKEDGTKITGFVLSGASKRGWSVWLAALSDERVDAIIPIVINILNTQKSIAHICLSYGGVCPPALRDYKEYNVTRMIYTQAFASLMDVEDPFSYLGYGSKYQARLTIPKYIINASGDDFFVPDSSKWYFKELPGDSNHIRYLSNAMHYFKGNPISDSTGSLRLINEDIDSYLYFILNHIPLPEVTWVFSCDAVDITSSMVPSQASLWVANNGSARDFRFINSFPLPKFSSSIGHLFYKYIHLPFYIFRKRIAYHFYSSMCDNCYRETNIPIDCTGEGDCKMHILLPHCKKGWRAAFVELHYDNVGNSNRNFVVTTEIDITPDTMPLQLSHSQLQEL